MPNHALTAVSRLSRAWTTMWSVFALCGIVIAALILGVWTVRDVVQLARHFGKHTERPVNKGGDDGASSI